MSVQKVTITVPGGAALFLRNAPRFVRDNESAIDTNIASE